MFALLLVLILTVTLSVFYILLTYKYKTYLSKSLSKQEQEEKEKSLDQLLDKYVVKEKKDIMKEKLSKISQIISETEKEIEETVEVKVKAAEEQMATLKAQGKELEVIQQASQDLLTIESGFKSAMPTSEAERLQDMAELKDAISILESFDEESYKVSTQKADAGVGMFYDKMARKFMSIINEQKLNQYKFVPVQRIKYHAFLNIKNLKDADMLPILNVMKSTKLLNDILEINSTFQLITFTDEKYKFTNPEKVLLTFAYDEDFLTVNSLLELTEWKKDYATKVLKGLSSKDLISVLDETITVKGFGHAEERKKWNEIVSEQVKKEKQKEEEKRAKQVEKAQQLKQQLAKVEKVKAPEAKIVLPTEGEQLTREELIDSLDNITAVDAEAPKIKFDKKPATKALPLVEKAPKAEVKVLPLPEKTPEANIESKAAQTPIAKEKEKEIQEIKEKDELLGVMEALDKESEYSEAEKKLAAKKKTAQLDVSLDVEASEEESNLEDLVPETILNFHEKFSLINGGLAQYEKIKDFVEKELENVPEDLLKAMFEQLKDLQMIASSIKIGKYMFYAFKEIQINEEEKKFIEYAVNKKPLAKEDFIKGLKWNEEKTLAAMKTLQEKGILRIEKNQVIIPGAVQK